MNDEERLKQGFSVRRAVLGDAHVDRAEASKTELNAEFQNFITRYAWGGDLGPPKPLATYSQPDYDIDAHRAQSCRPTQDASLRRLQQWGHRRRDQGSHHAQYCGLPAANGAFHLAAEVFASRRSAAQQAEEPQ
jgi:4-carboxymuconolactone decarboxylase